MGNILLCGIYHPSWTTSRLMSNESQIYFDTHVVPKIRGDSLLFVESQLGVRHLGDENYEHYLDFVSEGLRQQRIHPVLIGCDIRNPDAMGVHNGVSAEAQESSICFEELPQNYEQLVELARTGKNDFRTIRNLSPTEKQSVRVIRKKQIEFDNYLALRVRENSARNCFIVAGAIHCLHLHVQYGWPFEICHPTAKASVDDIQLIYVQYFRNYHWRP